MAVRMQHRGWLAVLLAALAPAAAYATGFQIQEQSGRALGTAFVGEAANPVDASTIFFNPAGMTRLAGTQLSLGGTLIWPRVHFNDDGSTVAPVAGGAALRGGDDGDGGALGLVPTAYISHALTDRWRLGLGVTVPFGLRTDWNRTWVGRYHAVLSELKTVDVAPSAAVKLFDGVSLGAGLDVQYAHANLTNMLDLGTICFENAPKLGLPSAACGLVGLNPQSVDGFVHIKGESWDLGWNAGVLWEITSHTRVGASYRSRIDHELEGTADFSIPKKAQILVQQSGALKDTGGRAALNLPDTVRFDVYHDLTARWAVQGGFTWTHWSRFQRLLFRFDNPKQPAILQPEGWNNSVRWGVATQYRPYRTLALRLGFAYDFTAVPDAEHRTPRIPDADRVWVSVGLGYQLTKRIAVDAGYAHLFATQDPPTRNADPISGNVLRGSFSAAADILGGQMTVRF